MDLEVHEYVKEFEELQKEKRIYKNSYFGINIKNT